MDYKDLNEYVEAIFHKEHEAYTNGYHRPKRFYRYIQATKSDSATLKGIYNPDNLSTWHPVENPDQYVLVHENLERLRELYEKIGDDGPLRTQFISLVLKPPPNFAYTLDTAYLSFEWAFRERSIDEALFFLEGIFKAESKYRDLLGPSYITAAGDCLQILSSILCVEYQKIPKEIMRKIRDFLFLAESRYPSAILQTHLISYTAGIRSIIKEINLIYLDAEIADVNMEINEDQKRAVNFLEKMGFPSDLADALIEIDKTYKTSSNDFDNKKGDVIREYWQKFLKEVICRIEKKVGKKCESYDWTTHKLYLKEHLRLNECELDFVNGWFKLLNNKLNHELKPKREYFRLMRSINIELTLLFIYYLRQLEGSDN